MGHDKATIEFNKKALITYVYDVARRIFDDIIIVTNNHRVLSGIGARVVRDLINIRSPISGIVTSLVCSEQEYTFVLACDMPFVTEKSVRYVVDNLRGEDVVIPRTEKGFEPLHAIYSRRCIPFFVKSLASGFMKIQSVFPYLNVKTLFDNPFFYNGKVSVFANINSKEDLVRFSSLF